MVVGDEDTVWCDTCGVSITEEQHLNQGGNCSNCELWWKLNDPDDYPEEDDDE